MTVIALFGRGRGPRDRGGATVLALALIAVVLLVGGAVIFAAASSAVAIAAQHAADQAALAGARQARAQAALGHSDANATCTAAREAAREHQATVTRCVEAATVVTVNVQMSRGWAQEQARAVAGPAYAP